MNTVVILFWIFFGIIFYTYIGYGMLLWLLVRMKRWFAKRKLVMDIDYEPEVTVLVSAYNEANYVAQKVRNTKQLNYPQHKIKQLWVTDGSTDKSVEQLRTYEGVEVLHVAERGGKIAAMNRGMQHVTTPIVIFSDANTDLGINAVREIIRLFQHETVGCVSGEKRIYSGASADAATAGEGLYWKYESQLKRWDAELHSVVGAAGELFAIRTALWQEVEADTLLDDFIISLRVAMKGYTIQYNPEAYAIETASANVEEEMKRKVRIAAGGIQSIIRLAPLLNIFKYKTLAFQYISHRVLRWTITPFLLVLLIPLNAYLVVHETGWFYLYIALVQVLFYVSAGLGWMLETRKIKVKVLFVPYYFMVMNVSVFLGIKRYFSKKQTVLWERSKRQSTVYNV